MASRFEIVDEDYIEEQLGVITECFQKVGERKKLASKLGEYENDVLDQ